MPVDHLAWDAYQRHRFMRPDAERFWRPDAARFMTPEAARQLLPESMWPNEPPHRKLSSYDLKADRSLLTELAAERAELLRLRSELAALRADLRFRQLLGKAYNPNQPRVLAGSPDGGQWTSGSASQQRQAEHQRTQLTQNLTGFTKHGINQAITRGIKPSAIHDALTNPIDVILQRNGTMRYVGTDAVVVLNPSGQVVTIWPTR